MTPKEWGDLPTRDRHFLETASMEASRRRQKNMPDEVS